jgi:hypothetical protein
MLIEVAGAILGLASAFLAWRELTLLPRKARQEILDRLREPTSNGLPWGPEGSSYQERVDAVVLSGMDARDLQSRFALPNRHLWRAVRHLYEGGKIEVFILEGIAEGHPDIPPGKKSLLPIFVRGAIPPDLRPRKEMVDIVFQSLR